jgi:hypothetical protein
MSTACPHSLQIGRKFHFRYLSLFFPRVDNPKLHSKETLIDGELVVDTDPITVSLHIPKLFLKAYIMKENEKASIPGIRLDVH